MRQYDPMILWNTPARWGTVARFFHWTLAALLLILIIVGLVMGDLPREDRMFAFTMHKSFGLLALGLAICRFVWRMSDKPPAPLPGTPKSHVVSAEIVHWALYALMLAVPVAGYLSSSYGHYPFPFFMQPGLQVPLLTPENGSLRETWGDRHVLLVWILIVVIALHVGAALFHHFVKKDAILARMTPFISPLKA